MGDGVNFVDPARLVKTAGFVARLVRNTVVGFVLGLLPALLIAWIRADRAPIVQRPDEFAELLRMPHLATVPGYTDRDMYDVLESDRPEIQQLVSNISSVVSSGVLLVVAPTPISAHVELVVKTAAALAQTGKRVMLIDADPSEQLTRFLGLGESFGLSDLLSGYRAEGARMASISFGRMPGLGDAVLRMMAAGTRRPQIGALARTPRAVEVFDELRASNDYVVVALPPLSLSASSTALGRLADGLVVSVERGTEVAAIEATRQQLEFFGTRGLGFVVIDD
jgi:Mrp family chromosome partitioning ATPase